MPTTRKVYVPSLYQWFCITLLAFAVFAVAEATDEFTASSQCAFHDNHDIAEVVLRYNLRPCSESDNSQGISDSSDSCRDREYYQTCAEQPGFKRIDCETTSGIWNIYFGYVSPGNNFTIDLRGIQYSGNEIKCNIREISGFRQVCQTVTIDLSGDVDLVIGDKYGSLELQTCTLGVGGNRPGSPPVAPFPPPTFSPIVSRAPSLSPISASIPTNRPTNPSTPLPTLSPTVPVIDLPTNSPTVVASLSPSSRPTYLPTKSPTSDPTDRQTKSPTFSPTLSPTLLPTLGPTNPPTKLPTRLPTLPPTPGPTDPPTKPPTPTPTVSYVPTTGASGNPTSSILPSFSPSTTPSMAPSSSQEPTISMAPTVTIFETILVGGNNSDSRIGQISTCVNDPTNVTNTPVAYSLREISFTYLLYVKKQSNIGDIVEIIESVIHSELTKKYLDCLFGNQRELTRRRGLQHATDVNAFEMISSPEDTILRSRRYLPEGAADLEIFDISSLPVDTVSTAGIDCIDSVENESDCYRINAAFTVSNIGSVDDKTLGESVDVFLTEAIKNDDGPLWIANENITELRLLTSSEVSPGIPSSQKPPSGIGGNINPDGSGSASIAPILIPVAVVGVFIVGALLLRHRRGGDSLRYVKHEGDGDDESWVESISSGSRNLGTSYSFASVYQQARVLIKPGILSSTSTDHDENVEVVHRTTPLYESTEAAIEVVGIVKPKKQKKKTACFLVPDTVVL